MKLNDKLITGAVILIVAVVILFNVLAELVPEAMDSGDQLNQSNVCTDVGCYWNLTVPVCQASATDITACSRTSAIPFRGLFAGSGIIILIIMAVFLVVVIRGAMKKKGK